MLIEPAELEKEIDDLYLAQVRYELELNYRNHLVTWSHQFGPNFVCCVFGAVNGAWDDVKKDLRNNRITLEQANMLVDKFLKFKLINQNQLNFYKSQYQQIENSKELK